MSSSSIVISRNATRHTISRPYGEIMSHKFLYGMNARDIFVLMRCGVNRMDRRVPIIQNLSLMIQPQGIQTFQKILCRQIHPMVGPLRPVKLETQLFQELIRIEVGALNVKEIPRHIASVLNSTAHLGQILQVLQEMAEDCKPS